MSQLLRRMINVIKEIARKTIFYDRLVRYRQGKDVIRWVKGGRSGPTPHLIKQATIKEYANKFNIQTLIETGTFMGDMVSGMRDEFDTIISIELSRNLCRRAKKKFSGISHVQILEGDSGKLLPSVLSSVTKPALFWLDAHCSAGFTEKSDCETPIRQELECILNHHITRHVILIDDAPCFTGQNDYPSLKELKETVLRNRPSFDVEVREDIIRIHHKNNENLQGH